MANLYLAFGQSKGRISPEVYGHFSEHIGGVFYDGLWVGEDSQVENVRGFRKALVDSFKKLHPPVLRWPGGCFAETYDWRDGIGPRADRPRRVNWWYGSDRRVESNQVGTHEFMDFCRMTGAQPYFAANMTSTTPLHIRNWVEYCNFPAGLTTLSDERASNGSPEPFGVRYWGIGNENWGGGGQMTPEQCAREYIRYTTIVNSVDRGNLKFVLCGPNGHDVSWTRRLLHEWSLLPWREAPSYGMSVHYYCGSAGDPLAFTEDEWYRLLFQADRMRAVIDDHRAAMDEFDPERKLAMVVDEWGCWHPDGSGPSKGYNLFEQQSTMRDAMVAAMTLNAFNNRADVVKMANVAQLCNNLHSLYLAGGEHFVETPNYHVFELYKTHMGAMHVATFNDLGAFEREGFRPMDRLSTSASLGADGTLTLTIANLSLAEAARVKLHALGGSIEGTARLRTLHHPDPHAHNDFDCPDRVRPSESEIYLCDGAEIEVPAGGIVAIIREGQS